MSSDPAVMSVLKLANSLCDALPGHSMVPQHILQQLCISKVDDPEDGSKALVSNSRASR